MPDTKICSRCKKEKPIEEFNWKDEERNLRQCNCKNCKNNKLLYYKKNREELLRQKKEYHKKNKEERKNYQEKYYKKNREKLLEQKKEYEKINKKNRKNYQEKYYEKNKEKLKKQAKEYRIVNEEKIKEKRKKDYLKNREMVLEQRKEYAKTNREKINKYSQKKRKEDISFKLSQNLSGRVRDALNGKSKINHTAELIGCSIKELKQHLEKQFKEGMKWENYGFRGWHIDHILPCASFNLLIEDEQKKCFHYTNLQPLWAKENLQKGKK